MDIDKILLVLGESYRKGFVAIVLCTLMMYPILFFSIDDFRNFDWYVQLLLSSGVSTLYIGTYITWVIAIIQSSDIFLFPVAIVATCGFGEIINWVYRAECNLQGFFFRVLIFTVISFVLIWALEKLRIRRERKQSSGQPK